MLEASGLSDMQKSQPSGQTSLFLFLGEKITGDTHTWFIAELQLPFSDRRPVSFL